MMDRPELVTAHSEQVLNRTMDCKKTLSLCSSYPKTRSSRNRRREFDL